MSEQINEGLEKLVSKLNAYYIKISKTHEFYQRVFSAYEAVEVVVPVEAPSV